jgi:hypothetical protein
MALACATTRLSVGFRIDVRGVVAAYEMSLLEDDAEAEALALERTTGEDEGRDNNSLVGIHRRPGLRSTDLKSGRSSLVCRRLCQCARTVPTVFTYMDQRGLDPRSCELLLKSKVGACLADSCKTQDTSFAALI